MLLSTFNFHLSAILLVIRVLCIGNSFSWDAVEQELVPLCEATGVEVEVHNLYYGGCSLQQHAEFLMRDTAAYSHRVCSNVRRPDARRARPKQTDWRLVKGNCTLRQALRDGRYDYISLQQASHDSGIRDSFEPWLSMLMDTVSAYQPEAQLCWMQTWAYSCNADHPAYGRYHFNQQEMWDSIVSCTHYVKHTIEKNHPSLQRGAGSRLLLVPCGAAIQNARMTKLGDTLCRDGYHLNYTYGRYTAACVWYEFLTGKDVRLNPYKNPRMTLEQRRLTQESAHKAIENANF